VKKRGKNGSKKGEKNHPPPRGTRLSRSEGVKGKGGPGRKTRLFGGTSAQVKNFKTTGDRKAKKGKGGGRKSEKRGNTDGRVTKKGVHASVVEEGQGKPFF